jgi:hypothetical protein
MMIYFRNLSKTLNQRSFDFEFFQKARVITKIEIKINNYFILFYFLIKKYKVIPDL